VTVPQRLRNWQTRTHPFIHTTPFGRTFHLYPDQSIDKCIFIDGAYELRFLQVIERFFRAKPHAIMLDVGANSGDHAIYLSRFVRSRYLLRPSLHIAERLKKNIELNGITNIKVHAVGLSDSEATLHFKLDTSGNLGATHFLSEPDDETIQIAFKSAHKGKCLSRNQHHRPDFSQLVGLLRWSSRRVKPHQLKSN
jgi:FkbM family methyltransferase